MKGATKYLNLNVLITTSIVDMIMDLYEYLLKKDCDVTSIKCLEASDWF